MMMAPRAGCGPTAWLAPAGLYLCAVGVNLVGIGWGLPGQGRDLLPPAPSADVSAGTRRSWLAVQDPARNLSLGAPAAEEAETPEKTLRRFSLFTADPDEAVPLMAVARLNPFAGRWDPGIAHYGGLFLYALGAWFKLAATTGAITVQGDPSFYLSRPEAMARIYLTGRLLVVLVSAAAIPLVWLMARRLYGQRIALLAAAVTAVIPAWIALTHIMKPWAFGVPCALAALAMGRRLMTTPTPRRDAAIGGVLAGLAVGAGIPYSPSLLAPCTGLALRRKDTVLQRLGWMAVATAAAAAAILAAHPYWLLAPEGTRVALERLFAATGTTSHPGALAGFMAGTLGSALGLPLLVAALPEGVWLAWKDREALPILLPTLGMMVATGVKTGAVEFHGDPMLARWALPAVLILAMLGVGGLCRLGRALPAGARWLPLLLLLPTLLTAAALLRTFAAAAGPDTTRHRAGAWINGLPAGTTIGVTAPLAPFRSPFFRMDRYRLVILPDPAAADPRDLPEYFLVAERSDLPASAAFQGRYREVRRFTPPDRLLGDAAFKAYPFADPPIVLYALRPAGVSRQAPRVGRAGAD